MPANVLAERVAVMSDLSGSEEPAVGVEVAPAEVDEALARELVARARTQGVGLVGPGGLLTGLTKTVLETALEAEMDEHLADVQEATP